MIVLFGIRLTSGFVFVVVLSFLALSLSFCWQARIVPAVISPTGFGGFAFVSPTSISFGMVSLTPSGSVIWLECRVRSVFATVTTQGVSTVWVGVVTNGGCVMVVSPALVWSLTFCRVLSLHLFFCSLTLSGFLVHHRLSCSRLFPFWIFTCRFNLSIS